ncbi:MAG: sialate O-acetylesterase [Kiritimatiellae bacterium]|nr:sialate O-acetylesterase [Kiritimatiellia bacterium]
MNCRLKKIAVMLLVVALGGTGFAELKLPSVFSNGMVLQRDQAVAVWGWDDPGKSVTVSFADQKQTVKAGEDGKFTVMLKDLKASKEPRILSVVNDAGEKKEIQGVLVGEVWLCSGQSNMSMSVSRSNDFDKEKAAANYPLIRMFLTSSVTSLKPENTCPGMWKVCTPENVGSFSAAAYFFGRRLHKELDVPVGLIRTSWGGTRIEAWTPMAALKPYKFVMDYKITADKSAKTFDPAVAEKKYQMQKKAWQMKVKAAKAAGKKAPRAPRKSIHPHKSQHYPANLYNAMINPFVPYGIRGAIWYQGESNAGSYEKAILYREMMETMVSEWRRVWKSEFPFYAVQLVDFRKAQVNPVEDSPWAFIRESFLKCHQEMKGFGIAVGIDVGNATDIHPKNKQAIGYRLAQQALARTYGKKIVAGSPLYTGMKKDGSKIVLSFDDAGSGLEAKGGALKTFAIAGADKKFVVAEAKVVGKTVVVSSPEVKEPVAVRYAWANNPVGCNLYNKEGFPASPFRTDDWAPMQ